MPPSQPTLPPPAPPSHSPQPRSHSPQPPHAFRPSPTRAATLSTSTPQYTFKSRAVSQPAGERSPAPLSLGNPRPDDVLQPDTGRGSPAGMFGVIGGSRTSSRHGGGLGSGLVTRANSFSAGEMREPRNPSLTRTLSSHAEEIPSRSHAASPFPTFSPSSTPSISPHAHLPNLPLPHSPPRAGANVTRSRSQSLAAGARTMPDRGFPVPMSTLENTASFHRFDHGWSDPMEGSNMSPFARGVSQLAGGALPTRFRQSGQPMEGRPWGTAWGTSAPEHPTLSPAPRTFGAGQGQPAYSTVVGGFGDHNPNTNGGRSGTSSRRHSVSVVGGPGGRRDMFSDGMGMGMTSPPGRGVGPLGFSDAELLPEQLGNALNLEIDESRRRGVEIEVGRGRDIPRAPMSASLPRFGLLGEENTRSGTFPQGLGGYASAPVRGRGVAPGGLGDGSSSDDRRIATQARSGFDVPGFPNIPGHRGTNVSTDKEEELRGSLPIGAGATRPGMIGQAYDPKVAFQVPRPVGFGSRSGDFAGPPSPIQATARHPAPYGAYNGPPARPPAFVPGAYVSSTQNFPTHAQPAYQQFPPGPPSPTSPSFSSLSLSDLGRGIPLNSLPPAAPLYIVAFKASRRDVYYCPDPTLLISNGDRVIVEADRGSDLGTVIYDQLTPIDVRDWQEKTATAALLFGASQHQPPGMAHASVQSGSSAMSKPRKAAGQMGGPDLGTLLAGVGASMDLGTGGPHIRGPLAKEIMPKRIFAKSAQGPEEQARMMDKLKDEYEAMMICREKVIAKGMPMQIVDAEYQWDRRKLTFYFKADKRIDFRDLTKENFRIFKSRIWMSMVPKDDPRV